MTDEDRVRDFFQRIHYTLHRREDGFYDLFDSEGHQVALLDWLVEPDVRNDRGGEVGSVYPLTLDEIESIIT